MALKVNIIGAGIYGLAVGCYLQMNGFDTEIFEMHNLPGGLCTSWKRKGYTFDGCIHWLMGSGPSSNMHEMWKELHAVQGREFIEWDEYVTVRTKSGEQVTIFTDPGKLEAEMIRVAPEDTAEVRSICKTIGKLSKADMPVITEKIGLFQWPGFVLPWVTLGPVMKRWSSITISSFCRRLKSRVLAEVLVSMFGGDGSTGEMPMISMLLMLAFMHKRSCGYPIGGSLEFARAIEKRYYELGGKIRYNAKVEKILIENDKAVGLLCDRKEYRCHEVISSADGHSTLFEMLDGNYISDEQRNAYANHPIFPSLIYISLGIGKDMSIYPHMSIFPLENSIVLEDGNLEINQLNIRFFTFDHTMAPPGKTTGIVMLESRGIEYWESLKTGNPQQYKKEKQGVGDRVIDELEKEFGGIKESVEVCDVATPATWRGFTGNWKGSYEGFLLTTQTMMKKLGYTVPGLENFTMDSQWSSIGGGLPPAGMNGREVAKIFCKKYGRKFRTVP